MVTALSKLEETWPRLELIKGPIDLSKYQFGQTLAVYTDGSCFENGKPGAYAGFGVYISDTCEWFVGLRLPAF